jgi:predicted exporter
VAVVGLVALRYRALRPTLVACLPAILSAAITVGLLSLAGVALNMLSLVALLMVVSMGVDYGVFLAEAGDDRAALGATRLSVLVSGCSTALGFGLLALSDHPSLSSIGSTACLGIVLCLLGAPLLQHLTRPRLPP